MLSARAGRDTIWMKLTFFKHDWNNTYKILSGELAKEIPEYWNRSDDALVLTYLLYLGFKPDVLSLSIAATNGSKNIVKWLLEEGSVDPWNSLSELAMSPFALTVKNGHLECVKLLLACSSLDFNNSYYIYDACINNHPGIVKLLLSDTRIVLRNIDRLLARLISARLEDGD